MKRPRLLDLFCGGGGAAMGYHRAGFEVVGVDQMPQPRYPFGFLQADVLKLDPAWVAEFDAIHASPPCQVHSRISVISGRQHLHVDHIDDTRALLQKSGKRWIMENVVGAPLHDPVMLCGTMFGLETDCGAKLWRHRLFEANFWIGLVPQCQHERANRCITVVGNHPRDHSRRTITVTGSTPQMNVVRNRSRIQFPVNQARRAMGIDWLTMKGLSQAIPPAYTQWLGERLLGYVARGLAA